MRTIKIYEKKDLEVFEGKLFFFLQGDNGYYRRNKLDVGSYNPDKTDYLLTITDSINTAGEDELINLKNHIIKRLEQCSTALNKAIKDTEDMVAEIHKYEQLSSMVDNYPTFRDAFEDISS